MDHPNDFESLTPNRPSWMWRAACAGTEVEVFFPETPAGGDRARRICSGCPVRAECLEFALGDANTAGIWAATDERERRRLRRERRAA